jgi:hypothetical protein
VWLVNWQGCGRKASWPELRDYLCEETEKDWRNVSQDNGSMGEGLKSEPPD